MCATCGCSGQPRLRLVTSADTGLEHDPDHDHPHDHDHAGSHSHEEDRTVQLQQKILAKNDALAQETREWLAERQVAAINLMSSPGAGKTTLLVRTIRDLAEELVIPVIEGDQATSLDATRISEASGRMVVQVNTGVGCHLDASMVHRSLGTLNPPPGSVVVIENVGNLVCPALFDLGEGARVVLSSVTEGADKPAKYPYMFSRADLVLVTKTDLLPYVDFDLARHAADIKQLSPGARILQLSATTGEGLPAWYDWLRQAAPPQKV
ncbi:MAG TPA: hydrogenase nickel incorporation protein HypB [Streptosporangiaceae bacterium]|jgi:hydrogenase nickel incorporation protein HypB